MCLNPMVVIFAPLKIVTPAENKLFDLFWLEMECDHSRQQKIETIFCEEVKRERIEASWMVFKEIILMILSIEDAWF